MWLCDHARRHLSDARDGQLPRWHELFIRFHVTVCPPCRRVDRAFTNVLSLLHDLRDDATPDAPKP
jgi:hypothetical protein